VAAPAVVSAPALSVFGFGDSGVGAGTFCILTQGSTKQHQGTIAAAAQGGIGNVAARSAFAILQSAVAGGAGLAAVNGAVQIGGGIMATIGPGIAFIYR
jgi:hypothetical protein